MTDNPFTFLVIGEDGTCHTEHHQPNRTDSFDDIIRTVVGDLLELIPVTFPGLALWCDEEARLRSRPVNPVASRLAFRLGGRAEIYAGPVAVTGMRRGGMVSLTTDQLDLLRGHLLECGGASEASEPQ